MTYYTIAYRPIGCHHWSPIDPEDERSLGWGYWMADLLIARKRCQRLNDLNLMCEMKGLGQTTRLEFRLATIEIAEAADLPIAGPALPIPESPSPDQPLPPGPDGMGFWPVIVLPFVILAFIAIGVEAVRLLAWVVSKLQ